MDQPDPTAFIRGSKARRKATHVLAKARRLRARATRILARGRQARVLAEHVTGMVREVVLAFGLHRGLAISGGSDSGHDASRTPFSLSVWVGPSAGGVCDACLMTITVGDVQCDVINHGRELHLHHDCFRRLVDEQKQAATYRDVDPAAD